MECNYLNEEAREIKTQPKYNENWMERKERRKLIGMCTPNPSGLCVCGWMSVCVLPSAKIHRNYMCDDSCNLDDAISSSRIIKTTKSIKCIKKIGAFTLIISHWIGSIKHFPLIHCDIVSVAVAAFIIVIVGVSLIRCVKFLVLLLLFLFSFPFSSLSLSLMLFINVRIESFLSCWWYLKLNLLSHLPSFITSSLYHGLCYFRFDCVFNNV